jgi:hypothetical protein
MLRLRLLLFATLPLLIVYPAAASNFAVGSCKPNLQSFPSISAAVSGVPSGSTVFVCPGIYPEQVIISQPVSLQGIASANQDQAVIVVPSTGLFPNATSIFAEPVAAQVLIQSTGAVNIANISVDGTGGDLGCASNTWVAGIFYATGSSGAVSRVKASGQVDTGCGVGIWAESDGTSSQFVTVEGSSVHDYDNTGIIAAGSGSTPTLTANIKGNFVSASAGLIGIAVDNISGAITSNDVSNATFAIVDSGPSVSVSSNTVSQSGAGILLEGGGTVSLNRIENSTLGVWFFADGGVVQSNRITATTQAAVEFNCFTGVVAHNTINDALVGLDNVPAGIGGANTFNNTATLNVDGCATAAVQANALHSSSPKLSRSEGSIWQWRTPVSPFGSIK